MLDQHLALLKGSLAFFAHASLFYALLWTWELFDRNPPFTTDQLSALLGSDEFEVIDWPELFDVESTPFPQAIEETFTDPHYSAIELEF